MQNENYCFDGESLYAHSLPGRKVNAMHDNPRVRVQVGEVEGEFGRRGVIAYGRYEESRQRDEHERAINLMLSRFPA